MHRSFIIALGSVALIASGCAFEVDSAVPAPEEPEAPAPAPAPAAPLPTEAPAPKAPTWNPADLLPPDHSLPTRAACLDCAAVAVGPALPLPERKGH